MFPRTFPYDKYLEHWQDNYIPGHSNYMWDRSHRNCHLSDMKISGVQTHLWDQASDNHFPRASFVYQSWDVLLNNITPELPQSAQFCSADKKLFA